jgi:hypothetical protein
VESKYGNRIALFFKETDINNQFNFCDTKYIRNSAGKISTVSECDRNLNKIVITKTEEIVISGSVQFLDINQKTIASLVVSRVVYENMYAVHHTNDGDENRTYLNEYIAQGQQNIVSNYDYEVQENENRRSIFLINPTYISTYVNSFKVLARAD